MLATLISSTIARVNQVAGLDFDWGGGNGFAVSAPGGGGRVGGGPDGGVAMLTGRSSWALDTADPYALR